MNRRITEITPQKRNNQRVNIFLDGEFAFGLARIVAAWLRIGQELTPDRIEQLKADDAREVALQVSIRLLSRRPYSVAEVRTKLQKRGHTPAEIDAVLVHLQESGLLDDRQFAQQWIENRDEFRPRGRSLLRLELRQRGLSDEQIEHALEDRPDDEIDLACQAAQKKLSRLASADRLTFRRKLGGFLSRRGFNGQTVAQAVDRLWQQRQVAAPISHDIEEVP